MSHYMASNNSIIRTNNIALLELFLFTTYAYFRPSQPSLASGVYTVRRKKRLIWLDVLF